MNNSAKNIDHHNEVDAEAAGEIEMMISESLSQEFDDQDMDDIERDGSENNSQSADNSNPLSQSFLLNTKKPSSKQNSGKKTKRSAESKKLVFLSNKVLEEVMQKPETTGTKIALRILEIYQDKKINMDFKNV